MTRFTIRRCEAIGSDLFWEGEAKPARAASAVTPNQPASAPGTKVISQPSMPSTTATPTPARATSIRAVWNPMRADVILNFYGTAMRASMPTLSNNSESEPWPATLPWGSTRMQ